MYGESSTLPPDVQALSEQLQKQQQELEKLRLEDLRHIQVGYSQLLFETILNRFFRQRLLCTQNLINCPQLGKPSIDKSKAKYLTCQQWRSVLRRVLSMSVFRYLKIIEGHSHTSLQKAKSENKFYSAMRDKEAVDNERKNLIRNVDKQAKVVEKLLASEKSLQSQLVGVTLFLLANLTEIRPERPGQIHLLASECKGRAIGEAGVSKWRKDGVANTG